MAYTLGCWLQVATLIATVLAVPARAQLAHHIVDQELAAANRSVVQGRVQEALDRLGALAGKIDRQKDKDAYWRTSAATVEILSRVESYTRAREVLNVLLASNMFESEPANVQWLQLYLGRTLAYQGKPLEGERLLRAVTAGDARLVDSPIRRAAAIVLSDIELGRDNVGQAAIWMRRAVIGALVDKGASSEEIVDVLTGYAAYLMQTRRLPEAYALFRKLTTLYATQPTLRGPRYLHFASRFLMTLTEFGDLQYAAAMYEILRDIAATVDIVALSVRETLYFHELYQLARTHAVTGQGPIRQRLKEIAASHPDFAKEPRSRVVFSFFALLADDVELADSLISAGDGSSPAGAQDAAHEVILRSFIAARRDKSKESITLASEALERIRVFHRRFENESSNFLPTITSEEREILSLIVGWNATRISTSDQADTLFQLQQFLHRDKGKLGVHARVARQVLKSDLQREDIRTRDRLQDLRDRLMDDATEALLGRIPPMRSYSPGETNDQA